MLCAAFWDRDQDTIWIARDPLGIYPLYYTQAAGEILFSTEIPPLLQHPCVSRDVNRAAIADHLCHRFPILEETYYQAIRRVPPGFVLECRGITSRLYRYWDPAPIGRPIRWIEEEQLEEFGALLDQAVKRHLALGRAGIFLSGGFDSISIAAVARDHCRRAGRGDLLALSLAFPGPECNEAAIQQHVAADLGIPQRLVDFDHAVGKAGLLQSALAMTASWPVPMLNAWNPLYHFLATLGKTDGCEVILTGGGGDEWLGVSPAYAADLLKRLDFLGLYRLLGSVLRSYRLPRLAMIRSTLWNYGARPVLGELAGKCLKRGALPIYRAHKLRRIRRDIHRRVAPDAALRRELEERALANLPGADSDGFYMRDVRLGIQHPLMAMECEELFESSRRLGVRILQPYWDADLVDFLLRTPPDMLNRGGRAKGLVRDVLAERFPGLGFERHKKIGATNLFRAIMAREGRAAWQTAGGARQLSSLGIVDENALAPETADALSGKAPEKTHHLWDVLNLETWLRPRLTAA